MARWEIDRWLMFAICIATVSIVQFVVCCGFAMKHYAGGDYRTNAHPAVETHAYHWEYNWLSDLGRDRAWSGRKNTTSAAYFNRSLIFLGFGLAGFFLIFHRSVDESGWESTAMELCGVVSAAGLILLGMTPVDRMYILHHLGLALWIVPMPLMSVAFALSCIKSGGCIGTIGGFIAGLFALAMIAAIVSYAMAGTRTGYVINQKIVVGVSLGWFAMVLVRVAAASIQIVTRTRKEWIEEQATRYSDQLVRHSRLHRD